MSKSTYWISLILFAILVALIGVYGALRIPYIQAKNEMPQGAALELSRQADDSMLLTWEPSDTADDYYVAVYTHQPGADGRKTCLFSALCTQPRCVLPSRLPEDEAVDLTVRSRRAYSSLGKARIRMGDSPISVACYLNRPKVEDLTAYVDAESAKVYLSWTGWQGDTYCLYLLRPDGSREELRESRHVGAELQFGASGDLPIPAYGESVTFVLDAFREENGIIFLGNLAETASVSREDFLGRTLLPACEEDGENRFVLTWNETKGARYQIRQIDTETGASRVLEEIPADGERVFRTERLRPYGAYCFEIAALGGDVIGGSEYAAPPERVELHTGAALCYATVWSMKDMDVFSAPGGTEKTGTMQASRAYSILEEKDGWFRIGTPLWSGYVDSAQCMINLPDYIGDLCSYDITNSYSSLYMVHEYKIPKVTDTVVNGYEEILLAPKTYLVPLLYPTAKKLIAAAETMAADGYRIRIYDSFRPNRATRSIYDLAAEILDEPIPDETFTGKKLSDLPTLAEDEELTYKRLMTNGVYTLGNFLAAGGSMHNFGVAMDLTMERASDRAELPMQTSMHDLSWYSAISRNNANANLLRGYMLGAGFGGLTSEWWHFQDNEALAAARPANRWAGVSPEGWRRDDTGWRYRLADGSWCRAAERTIDGVSYRFDDDGYAAQQ